MTLLADSGIIYLFGAVRNSCIGCFVGNVCYNVLACADALVVTAPLWRAIQSSLNASVTDSRDFRDAHCGQT